MFRSVGAILISLLVHVVVLANLSMPVSTLNVSDVIQIRINKTILDEIPFDVPELVEPPTESQDEPRQEPESFPEEIFEHPEIDMLDEQIETEIEQVPVEPENVGHEGIEEAVGISDENLPGEESAGHMPDDAQESGEGAIADGVEQGTGEGVEEDSDNLADEDETEQSGPDRDRILNEYRDRVLAVVSAHRDYPTTARRLGQEGNVRVRFRVAEDGTVSSIVVESSSGFDALDDAAVDAVRDASPLPPIPGDLELETITMSLQIVFTLD